MKKYQSDGLSFVYPENWTLFVNDGDEVSGGEETNEVTIQSPNSCQLTVGRYDFFESSDELIQRTIDALTAEYEDLDVEPVEEMIGNVKLTGVDVSFFYLDLLIAVEVRVAERENEKLLLIIQSESRELEENDQVFQAILLSLFQPGIVDSIAD